MNRNSILRAASALAVGALVGFGLVCGAKAETLTVWGKSATVIAGPMKSGRAGFDAVMVRWTDGREAFVLKRTSIKRNGKTIPCAEAATDIEVETCFGADD